MFSSLNQRVERLVKGSRSLYGLEVGSSVWVPCDKNVWRAGVMSGTREEVINGVTKTMAVIDTMGDRGREKVVLDIEGTGPTGGPTYFLRNGDASNAKEIKIIEDLSKLAMLHEPEVLQTVKTRYADLNIYTFAGPMLLAVNPYQQIPGLYDAETLKTFINAPYGKRAPKPHIFGTARDAFLGIQHSNLSQTVLVSGESGAGKTESAKFVIRFLALAGGRQAPESEVSMEQRVLESVPLLESLGNARTLKNNNSSRFGKFIEVKFKNEPGVYGPCIMNAETHTYLLETVRVTELSEGERLFHIFYQILAAAAASSIKARQTGQKMPSLIPSIPSLVFPDITEWSCKKFRYLKRSTGQPEADEAMQFHRNIEAMRAFQMSDEEISQVISAIVACLYLGNIDFQVMQENSEASEVVDADLLDGPLCKAADLLGVDSENLELALCSRVLHLYEKSTKQVIRKSRTILQARDCRDGLARHLYMMVFAHVLSRINQSLSGGTDSAKYYAMKDSLPSIGVLDIFGFEVFEHNCFEQLCINYANEVLQQHFNMVVFEHELALYEEEGIRCDLEDMQAASKLHTSIRESNVLPGAFPMLDDECTIADGSSDKWLSRVAKAYGECPAFQLVPLKKGYFMLQHFAGPVEYCADAFLAKNKDTLSAEAKECMQGSSKIVLQQTFSGHGRIFGTTTSMTGRVLKAKANSVSSDFREQLDKLMKNIQATRPHFVRCVKPNQMMAANLFDSFSVLQQLKYQGVLEAIRVARAGFPTRFQHSQALLMYWKLAPSLQNKLQQLSRTGAHYQAAMLLFSHLRDSIDGLPPGSIQVGKSLTFFKSEATEILSFHVQKFREVAALQVQTWWRMCRLNRRFREVCKAVIFIQRVELGRKARTGFRFLRRAATTIQASWRTHEIRQIFKQVVKAVICIQRFLRPRLAATKKRTRMLYGRQPSPPVAVPQERAVVVANPKSFGAPAKFARYLKAEASTAVVPRQQKAPAAQEGQLVRASEVDKVKEQLGSQIREQQEQIQQLFSMVSAQQGSKDAETLAAVEQQSIQNQILKEYVSAQLHAMHERMADLGTTLVAMDSAVAAEKQRREEEQAALREQYGSFQASIQQQFQTMRNDVSNLVRGAETDTAKVTGSLMELENMVTSKFSTLEQSFESTRSQGQSQLDQAIEGLRNDLDAKHRAIEDSVSVINPRLGDIATQCEGLSGLESHVRDLMQRHQAMFEEQQKLLAAPDALKSQLGGELEERQAALRREMAGSMEQALVSLRQDMEKTHSLVQGHSELSEAQRQQATSLIAEQRSDMAASMEAALSTLKQYMNSADGVGQTIGKRHEEMEEKNAQHISLLRGEMAKAMGAMLTDLQRDAALANRQLPLGAGTRTIYKPGAAFRSPSQDSRPTSVTMQAGIAAGPARRSGNRLLHAAIHASQDKVAQGSLLAQPGQLASSIQGPGGSQRPLLQPVSSRAVSGGQMAFAASSMQPASPSPVVLSRQVAASGLGVVRFPQSMPPTSPTSPTVRMMSTGEQPSSVTLRQGAAKVLSPRSENSFQRAPATPDVQSSQLSGVPAPAPIMTPTSQLRQIGHPRQISGNAQQRPSSGSAQHRTGQFSTVFNFGDGLAASRHDSHNASASSLMTPKYRVSGHQK